MGTVAEGARCAALLLRMVNYYLRKFLPDPERQPVGADKQFESDAIAPLDLGCVRGRSTHPDSLFLSAPDAHKGARSHGATWTDPQRDLDEREG